MNEEVYKLTLKGWFVNHVIKCNTMQDASQLWDALAERVRLTAIEDGYPTGIPALIFYGGEMPPWLYNNTMKKPTHYNVDEILARFEREEKELDEEPKEFRLCGKCDIQIFEGDPVGSIYDVKGFLTVCGNCYTKANERRQAYVKQFNQYISEYYYDNGKL